MNYMPKMMKPITFGCGNGFQEVFYDMEAPIDRESNHPGNAFCYLARLSDAEKKDDECLKKCVSMEAGKCWKV